MSQTSAAAGAAGPRAPRIVTHNVASLYRETSRESERISQTLMGRLVDVVEENEDWVRIQTDDAYRGWVEGRWLAAAPEKPAKPLLVITAFTEIREAPREDAALVVRAPILSAVYVADDALVDGWAHVTTPAGVHTGYAKRAHLAESLPKVAPADIQATAIKKSTEFLGTPYLWGGSSPFGIDCSGFCQLSYRLAGITLRRDAHMQRDDPRFVPVEFADLLPGDLVFFSRNGTRITHVGMHFAGRSKEGGSFIHSAGAAGVDITLWSDPGYPKTYVDARRLDPARALEPVTPFEGENRLIREG